MTAKRGTAVPLATFARLWADESLTLAQIGAMLGVSGAAVTERARRRGLPSRFHMVAKRQVSITDEATFRAMWQFGVGLSDLVRHFGCTHRTILATRDRLGLPKRRVTKWNARSLGDFRALQLRDAMARSAAETRQAMILSDMVDGRSPQKRAA